MNYQAYWGVFLTSRDIPLKHVLTYRQITPELAFEILLWIQIKVGSASMPNTGLSPSSLSV